MEERDLTRREALKVAASSALAAGIGSMIPGSVLAATYSKEELKKRSEAIVDYTTSPAFLDELNAVLSAPKERQLAEASRRFDPSRLRVMGLEGPEKTRISTRIFDETTGKSTILGGPRAPVTLNIMTTKPRITKSDIDALIDRNKISNNVATSVCVCVGGGVCVGVGGGD